MRVGCSLRGVVVAAFVLVTTLHVRSTDASAARRALTSANERGRQGAESAGQTTSHPPMMSDNNDWADDARPCVCVCAQTSARPHIQISHLVVARSSIFLPATVPQLGGCKGQK